MKRVVMRAAVDGTSRALGVFEDFDAAWDAVLSNGWIPRGAQYRIAGAIGKQKKENGRSDPGLAVFIVEHGDEEFVLVIMSASRWQKEVQ